MPLLIKSLDPFDPAARTVERIPKNRRIAAMAPKSDRPVVCIYNGQPLLRAGWKRRVKHGDTVAFVVMPRGRGIRQLLSIVVMAVVAFYAPYLAGAMGVTSSFGVAMVGMALNMAASLLLNAILPAPKPPTPQSFAEMSAPSPTYNVAAQGNMARLEQPIPVHYGRHIAYPDFAARPYQEYQDNEQYLYQLLAIGQGEYDVEAIRIEDTPITSFEGAQTELVGPGQSVTLFPAAVIQSTEIGGAEIIGLQGPFVASGPEETVTAIGVDLVCPSGLYYSNDQGGMDGKSVTVRITARLVDDNGDPLGGWITLGQPSISGATNTAIRRSYQYNVAPGRYEVRAERTDAKDGRSRAAHAVHWTALRAYLPDTTNYGNITLLAVKLKATAQISEQATRKVNVIATRKLPVWHPDTGWSAPTATRNIAWALADICRASYGASLADDRYDLAGLYALAGTWAARTDTFDARFDGKMTIGEALTIAARAGRAKWYQQAGKVRFWRDGPQTVPQYMFTPRNIVAGSFSMEYAPAVTDTSDGVRLAYFDERYWRERDATCVLAGSAGGKLADIKAFGMVNRAQVVREGMKMAADNRYRRRIVKLETEMDGYLVRFGDLVGVVHDVPQWGQSGEIIGWDAGTLTAVLSEPPAWAESGNHYVRLVRDNGTPTGIIQVSPHATDPHRVTLLTSPGFAPEWEGYRRERTRYAFGPANQIEMQVLLTAIRPKDRTRVEIEAVVEDPRVHDAETGTIPDDTAAGYPNMPSAPVVTGLIVSEAGSPAAPQQIITWQPAEGATHYLVEYTTDDINWIKAGDTTGSRWTLEGIPPGQYFNARVAAMGLLRGPWAYASGTSGAKITAPGGIVDLRLDAPFTGTACDIRWSPAPRANRYRVRVHAGGNMRRETTTTDPAYRYTIANAIQDGGPWRDLEFRVMPMGVASNGDESTIIATNTQAPALNNIQLVPDVMGARFSANASSAPDVAGYQVWASKETGYAPGPATLVYEGTAPAARLTLGLDEIWYIRAAAFDVWGKDSLATSGEFSIRTGEIDFSEINGAINAAQLATDLATPISKIPGIESSARAMQLAQDDISTALLRSVLDMQAQRNAVTDAGLIIDPATGRASLYALEKTTGRVSAAEVRLGAAEGEISLRATLHQVNMAIAEAQLSPEEMAALTDLDLRIASAEQSLSAANAAIQQKASLLVVQQNTARISTAEQEIDAMNVEIVSKASNAEFTAAEQRLATAEASLSAIDGSGIINAVSDIRQINTDADQQAEALLRSLINQDATRRAADYAVASAREEITARTTAALAAEATARTSLAAAAGGNIAQVQTLAIATANALGEVSAEWGVQVQTMQDGRRAIAGIKLLSGADDETVFAVMADRLIVYRPDGTGTPQQIMAIGLVNGVSALGLRGDLLIDGSIVARHLSVDTLSAMSANLGNVTAGTASNAAATNVINFNAVGAQPFIKVGTAATINANGSMVFNGASLNAGSMRNLANTNFINLDATGTQDFLKVSNKVAIKADGSAVFDGPVITRNLSVASGTAAALAGTYGITPGVWTKLATVTIDTGHSVGAWWDSADKAYQLTAGVNSGFVTVWATSGNFGSFVANWAVQVTRLYPKSKWTGPTTLLAELELWAETDGAGHTIQFPAPKWALFKVT